MIEVLTMAAADQLLPAVTLKLTSVNLFQLWTYAGKRVVFLGIFFPQLAYQILFVQPA